MMGLGDHVHSDEDKHVPGQSAVIERDRVLPRVADSAGSHC